MENNQMQTTPVPTATWQKWLNDLENDADNGKYLEFNAITMPREFYNLYFDKDEYIPYVYLNMLDDQIVGLTFIPIIEQNGVWNTVGNSYYCFDNNNVLSIIDKEYNNFYCKQWKEAGAHAIFVKAYTIPPGNFRAIFKDNSVDEVFFTFGKDNAATDEQLKIKLLISPQRLSGSKGDGDPVYDDSDPCPPFCKEPGGDG